MTVPGIHWHEHNPWKDRIVYVTVEELASCVMFPDRKADAWVLPEVVSQWQQYGDKLDAYILVGGPVLTGGVRFGPEPENYLSPGVFSLPKLTTLAREAMGLPPTSTRSS